MSDGQRWPRDLWAEAVWSSDLRPVERLVALCFADHAHDRHISWVSQERLRERTGLARSTAVAAVQTLVRSGWLVEVEKARQHRSARYRLVQPTDSRSSEPTDSRSPDDPADRLSAPADRLSAPADRYADPKEVPIRDPQPVLAADLVIVQPEDREPHSDDAVFDACRAAGAPWSLGDVITARRKLITAFGGSAKAAGAADAALKDLASRRPIIRSIGGFLAAKERQPEGLDSLRVATGSLQTPRPVLGCPECTDSPAGVGFLGSADSPEPCSCRRAAQKARAS